MKTKELKNLAKKIAKYERIVQDSNNAKEVREAQEEIMKLSGQVHSFEDIVLIDELVQEILSEKS